MTRAIGRNGKPFVLYTGSVIYLDNNEHQAPLGLSPREHLDFCNRFASQGYYPVAIAVASLEDSVPLVAASIWHKGGAMVLETPSQPPGVSSDEGNR